MGKPLLLGVRAGSRAAVIGNLGSVTDSKE